MGEGASADPGATGEMLLRCEHATALVKGERVRAVIGDVVEVELPEGHDKGIIVDIAPRRTSFVRRDPAERTASQVLAANFDLVIVAEPIVGLNRQRLERELVLAHETGADVAVVLTKSDLADGNEAAAVVKDVSDLAGRDVAVLAVSTDDPDSVERVRALVGPGSVAVLIGKSGVGKSSLVNLLAGAEVLADECRRAELENNNLHVANSVLDNCLSTLKHETMYYPSRIRQLVDSPEVNMQAIDEVVTYYRDIYVLLSRQAMHQVSQVKLHLAAVELYGQTVLGDKTLLRYLFEILTKQKKDISAEAKDDKYVLFTVRMPQLHLRDDEVQHLFTPAEDHIPYLLCRQIVRDHSEATNRRGCGIWAENINGITTIKITLPRWNHSK